MKLIAPAMASEPYTAEAPPVAISTRSMSMSGMMPMSERPVTLAGMKRLPSTSTRVRTEPKPRKSGASTPSPPL